MSTNSAHRRQSSQKPAPDRTQAGVRRYPSCVALVKGPEVEWIGRSRTSLHRRFSLSPGLSLNAPTDPNQPGPGRSRSLSSRLCPLAANSQQMRLRGDAESFTVRTDGPFELSATGPMRCRGRRGRLLRAGPVRRHVRYRRRQSRRPNRYGALSNSRTASPMRSGAPSRSTGQAPNESSMRSRAQPIHSHVLRHSASSAASLGGRPA